MQISVEFTWLVGLFFAFLGVLWAFGKILVNQFEKHLELRFDAQDKAQTAAATHWEQRFYSVEDMTRRAAQDIVNLKIDLPKVYVQREDWIRFATSFDHKIDSINHAIHQLTEKFHARN
ncbi:MAG: hypothetical protein PHP85_14710 [Gallionella sp.]|nr:hypothetical protein [Gallionella sp.]